MKRVNSELSGTTQGAGGVGGLLSMTVHGTPSATFYPTYDGNGNVSEYLDSSGQTVAHFEYDPFGRLLDTMPLVSEDLAIKQALSYRFSTKPINFATGLYYYGYRWYDPQTGRWPSRDPIEEGGGDNIYGFVGNASAYEIDALGMFTSSSPYESVGEAHRLSISIPTLYAPRIPPTPLAPPLPIWWDATFGFDGLNAEGIAQCVRCPDGKSRIWKEGNFSFEWSASAGIQVGIPNISVGGATLFIGGRVEGKITGNLGIQVYYDPCKESHGGGVEGQAAGRVGGAVGAYVTYKKWFFGAQGYVGAYATLAGYGTIETSGDMFLRGSASWGGHYGLRASLGTSYLPEIEYSKSFNTDGPKNWEPVSLGNISSWLD